jgi:hypothetical protein
LPGLPDRVPVQIDDAGNSLRKYLFNYSIPEVLRIDTTYPKAAWNLIHITAIKCCKWFPEEKNYYPRTG